MALSPQLRLLATLAGIQVEWTDAYGHMRELDGEVVRRVLDCLGYSDHAENIGRLRREAAAAPAMLTADAGHKVTVPHAIGPAGHVVLHDESDRAQAIPVDDHGRFQAPADIGYYTLEIGEHHLAFAVAPARCFSVADATGKADPHVWGLTAQVYGLRDPVGGGLGTSQAAGALAARIGAAGGDALCLSPLHAMSPVIHSYSPYTPSHRGFLNWLHAAPQDVLGEDALHAALDASGQAGDWQRAEESPLIDWQANYAMRKRVWRTLYQLSEARAAPALKEDLQAFLRQGGAMLRAHALFAARQTWAVQRGAPLSWLDWPVEWRERGHAASGFFAASQADDLRFEMFLQWATVRAWAKASARASAGMEIGLIADVAVGFEPGGSEAWRNRDVLLQRMTLGAPPDAFNARGQGWGVTSYAPRALRGVGYQPFLELLRSNMSLGGGIRLDHIMGLSRLWVIPDGLPSSDGAYLNYPMADLLRLVALESVRHRCIVIGEDLGTVSPSLRTLLAARGILGTEVLLFNKDQDARFLPPSQWRRQAAATTTTHDLPPLASWQRGGDIDAAKVLGLQTAAEADCLAASRDQEVARLRATLKASGSMADGDDAAHFNDSALHHVAQSASVLVLVPVEDALGLTGQPNVPGTVEEYPNWRQRLPASDAGKLEKSMQVIDSARREAASDA